ncbi:unnamed protein product [Urochloa humidicola]
MANFVVNPRPHVPQGFTVTPHDPAKPPRRLFVYIGGVMDAYNEDLIIAFFTPAVSKQDFDVMSVALKDFFANSFGVHLFRYRTGDAFVRFMSPVERERFLVRIIRFSPDYQLSFIKHDAGVNVRMRDLDREVWLMVMMFSEDARNNNAISKALAGFGLLRYWYDTDNHARIVVKVHLHDEAQIPHDIVVSAGLEPRVRSWTCPVFMLKHSGVQALGDEDLFSPGGLVHPISHDPPRWMGPGGSEVANGPEQHHNEDESVAGGGSAGHMQEADQGIVPVQNVMPVQNVVPVEAAPNVIQILSDNEVILALNLSFPPPPSISFQHFNHLRSLIIDLDTVVPSYVADHSVRFFLAVICSDQVDPAPKHAPALVVFGPALPPGGLPLVEVQECPSTTRKRHHRRMSEPLEKQSVRRSKRLNPDVGGFRDASSEQQAADNPSVYSS